MPAERWLVRWKRNRNHKGEEVVFSHAKAIELAEEKKQSGHKKISVIKLPRRQF